MPVPSPSSIYIERALINPSGNDAGREVVVLASLVTTAQTLTNWRLMDKNGRMTPGRHDARAGQSVAIALDGNGVQLGNQGGNLILQDNHNVQVDVVTYTSLRRLFRKPLLPLPPLRLRVRRDECPTCSGESHGSPLRRCTRQRYRRSR